MATRRIGTLGRRAVIDAAIVGALAMIAYQVGRLDALDKGPPQGNAPRAVADEAPPAGGERGRLADSPTEFRASAWRDILLRTYSDTMADKIPTVAGGIAFYGLLALFPGIAALVSLYGLVADPATIRDHLVQLSFLLPPDTFAIVEDQINRVVAQGGTALGIKFALGLCLSIWSANAGMKALIDGLNVAYEEEEKRSFLRLNLASLGLTAAALLSLLAIIGLAAVVPQLFAAGATSTTARIAAGLLRWPVMLAFLAMGLSVLYRYGPSRTEPKWRWVTPGGTLAALLVVIISLLLSWYLTNLADYNKTYGSLGAVIGLITWMWLAAIAVLVGAELNAEMEHQTARDSTVGMTKPMGLRGATMADEVARSPP